MSKCPVCQGSIKDDFGLIECDHCGAPLIVAFDGSIEHAKTKAAAQADVAESIFEEADSSDEDAADHSFSEPEVVPVFAPPPDAIDELAAAIQPLPPPDFQAEDPIIDDLEAEPFAAMPLAEELPQELTSATPAAADELPEFTGEEPEAPVYKPEKTKDPADLSDLAAFGNADLATAREGPLRYNLYVAGIDTKDVREAFREALTDRKFMWDTDQILRSIKHGQVKIADATASKAYLLVIRLRNLPVQIRWEQYVVHSS